VPWGYQTEDLLAVLGTRAPRAAHTVAAQRRDVLCGLLSVGLKLHCLGPSARFDPLVEALGGVSKILDINHYRNSRASLCLVLPPVGNAETAIALLEGLEQFLGLQLFGNPEIQIQICSPGRLSPRRAAFLAIAFYLGSDTLRRYSLTELETTFTANFFQPRGRRLVLYDAGGDFDWNFDWWNRSDDQLSIEPRLPMDNGRSDLLVGSGSRLDIKNINLIATLLTHAEYDGYWRDLGRTFEAELALLLDRHLLSGLIDAPWVRTKERATADDQAFLAALQELVAYAFEEAVRIKQGGVFRPRWREIPAKKSNGILQEIQALLGMYRNAILPEPHFQSQRGRK
jgi:hypothetical protein